MIVVTDASPLHYLVLLNEIELLHDLYGGVVCPKTVWLECLHPHAPDSLQLWACSPPAWLEVVDDVVSNESDEVLHSLDPGERAALILAKVQHADLVLMDERKGRIAAEALGLKTVGVLGILVQAARRGRISFEDVTARLLSETNFRVSPQVLNQARAFLRSAPPV